VLTTIRFGPEWEEREFSEWRSGAALQVGGSRMPMRSPSSTLHVGREAYQGIVPQAYLDRVPVAAPNQRICWCSRRICGRRAPFTAETDSCLTVTERLMPTPVFGRWEWSASEEAFWGTREKHLAIAVTRA
jgi:hypothetical protein